MESKPATNGHADPAVAKLEGRKATMGIEDVDKSWAFSFSIIFMGQPSATLSFGTKRPAILDLVTAERGTGGLKLSVCAAPNKAPKDWMVTGTTGGPQYEVLTGIDISLAFQNGRIPPTTLNLPLPLDEHGMHQITVAASGSSSSSVLVSLAGHFTD
jgi:hypothetical protein